MPITTSSFNTASFKTANITAVKQSVQNLIDIFKDNWYYIIEDELKDQVSITTFDKYQWLITQEINVLKRVIKELSIVYTQAPERKAVIPQDEVTEQEAETDVDTEAVDENYELSQKDTNKNMVMQRINQLTNLVNHTLLKITYRNEKLDYDVINFNNAEIYCAEDDWMDIVAVKHFFGFNLPSTNSRNPSLKLSSNEGIPVTPIQSYKEAKLWVKKDIKKSDVMITDSPDDEMLEGGFIYTIKPLGDTEWISDTKPIPYFDGEDPILPFVLFSKEYPFEKLLDFTTGNDLRDLNINIAILMIWLNSLEKYQSFKQIVFNTDNPEKIPDGMAMGPADTLVNPTRNGEGTVQVLDLQTDIKSKFQVIKERIMTVLAGYGISPENFTMSAAPSSGFALKISNMGKVEARKMQIPMYHLGEKETFDKERIIWNTHRPTELISKDAELIVDFAELDFPKSTKEKAEEFNFLQAHNILTEIDLIMQMNPELTREQAEEEYARNKAFNDANKPVVQINPVQQPGGQNAMRNQTQERERQR